MEKSSEQGEEQTLMATTTTSPPLIQPLATDREGSEVESMSGSNLLITYEVEANNTIISVGDYSFHTKSKVVLRKRTKRFEGAILWTPQGDKPKQRAMQFASALGAFATMNLGAEDDSRREIESLRAEVSALQESLQKTTTECTTMTARAE